MKTIFIIIRDLLVLLSKVTGFSYKAINIIVYYYIIPFVFILFIDEIYKIHYFKISFILVMVIFTLLIKDFENFSEWLFNNSAKFLNSFSFIGWNYVLASVIICVFIPIIILSFLVYLAFK